MSSYPDPPAADAGVASTVQSVTTHDPAPSNYDPLNSPIAASAAHHGLQALQAATAGPVSPPGQAQYAPMGTPVSTGFVTPGMSPGTAQSTVPLNHMQLHQAPKQTRLRRACDMCSKRKVKCDDNGPPCTPCRELNLTCTRDREMKRRGPPNKHAEAAKLAKRTRIEPNLPVSPHLAEAISSMGTVEGVPLDAELIAPIGVLKLLVDDFFTYIHPLIPFPHEPSFRQSFENREDRTSREYLALLSSMICCLVASFPRSARDHLKAQQSANLFPRSITMIERCRLVALEARGNRFSNKEDMTVYDAATSYFLGLAAGYTLQWKLCRRFMAETLTIIRELGYHKPKEAIQEFTATYAPQQLNRPTDYIKDEVGKRVFWVMLLGVRSMAQLGAPHGELVIPPPTPAEPYPDLPMEVDDEYIRADGIDSQPPGKVSFITGFNHAVRIYLTMNPLVSVELSYGIGSLEWFGQKTMIEECLQACKPITNDLPADLQLGPVQPGPTDPVLEIAGFEYVPPKFPEGQPDNDVRNIISRDATKRRKLQFEIQKANVYVSQLATRSYYVEKYFNLRDAYTASKQQSGNQANGTNGTQDGEDKVETDEIDAAMSAEREMIVENLLSVLASISQRSLEPNGASVINKIRQVASTLISGPSERKGPVAQKNEESLSQFMDILMRLEKGARSHMPGTQSGMTAEDEEEELQAWASLREHQLKFAAGGGFLNILNGP